MVNQSDLEAKIEGLEWLVYSYKKENMKLQELVHDMWEFTREACERYPRLFDLYRAGGLTVRSNKLEEFGQRMRELEIEVE